MNKFPQATIINEEHVHFDHRPLVLDTEYYDGNMFNQPGDQVKLFVAQWLKEETVVEIVRTTWDKAKILGIGPFLTEHTRAVHADLHTWDRDILRGRKEELKELKKDVENLRRGPMNAQTQAQQKDTLVLIENLLEQEEIY